MKYRYFFWIFTILFVLFGCGQKFEKIDIDVPDSVKQGIEEAAPVGTYRFCALDVSYPKNYEDLKQSTLFICGEIDSKVGQQVVLASMDENNSLLFGMIRRFFINTNLISGELSVNEIITITPDGGENIVIPSEQSIYGQDHSFNAVLGSCLQEMEGGENSILLIERKEKVDSDVLNRMVEIKFK